MTKHIKRALALAGVDSSPALDAALVSKPERQLQTANDKIAPMTDDEVRAMLDQIFAGAGVGVIGDDTGGQEGSGTTSQADQTDPTDDLSPDQALEGLLQALGCGGEADDDNQPW